mgnify:FL=1
MRYLLCFYAFSIAMSQVQYNHPELDWQTFETDNFRIHFYSQTENSARKGALIAEKIFIPLTSLYNYKPPDKTDIIFTDTDDISNGAAYFYDNKIVIWTSPLDFPLRGSHRWLQNVITHEFAHIVSIQSSQKFGKSIPGGYLQWIGYEKEKRPDVLYGYPNVLVSYPIPGTSVPPWLAEGVAQYMYPGADWDYWDSTRDMILRDQVLNNNTLSWNEINTFGKSGIGNESVYNSGFAFSKYIASKYNNTSLSDIMKSLSSPFNFSIRKAMKEALGKDGREVYADYIDLISQRYNILSPHSNSFDQNIKHIDDNGTANLLPKWSEDGQKIAYLSNQNHDYFGSTDLFIYNLKEGKSHKIVDGVISKPTWNGNTIIYSKRSTIPNKVGSRYFDLYEYDLLTKKETRLTKDLRAFSPVFSKSDSAIYFLSTYDGTQNIFKINLSSSTSEKISNFSDHEIINNLTFDPYNNRLLFDMTINHNKSIYFLSLADSTQGMYIDASSWDARNADVFNKGIVYSDDRTGIFNLYYIDDKKQGYISNTAGGAFMADYHKDGKLVFSHFQNGKFSIALIDSIKIYDDEQIGYTNEYYKKNESLVTNIIGSIVDTSTSYEDHFPPMFFMPRATMDYGKIKLGSYFYSSEILEKVSLIGGASFNQLFDQDIFFLMEYKHLYPTLFFETYYMTRNKEEDVKYSAYNLKNNIKFRLLEFKAGARFPFYGTQFELFSSWSQYRASIKENIQERPEIRSDYGYEYFKGSQLGLNWFIQRYKQRVDRAINPIGFRFHLSAAKEFNQFIEGLDLSDSGTLTSSFGNHDLFRTKIDSEYSFNIPNTNRSSIKIGVKIGSISNMNADSFFYFFGGGYSGLKGYPYYSLQGSELLIADLGIRFPIFKEKNYTFGPLSINSALIGFESQAGDAWKRTDKFNFKQSYGAHIRISGYSFYNYPTAIGLEYHKPLKDFSIDIGDNTEIMYGAEDRIYFNILFGF